MTKPRKWTDSNLASSVKKHYSVRSVIEDLGLVPAGGNYVQINRRIKELELDAGHFTGSRWNRGLRYNLKSTLPVESHLVLGSIIQSHKLKNKLFAAGIKKMACELCGWAKVSTDGRIPLELDHINGIRNDNRVDNLRILCPNCHSLQPTHRGRNKKTG